jgi:hypothetical protein
VAGGKVPGYGPFSKGRRAAGCRGGFRPGPFTAEPCGGFSRERFITGRRPLAEGFVPQGGDKFRASIQFGLIIVKAGDHQGA